MPPRMLKNEKVGKVTLRLAKADGAFKGVIIGADGAKKAEVEGTDPDDVWRRLRNEAGKASPSYFGFDGARARFRRYFPDGFLSESYVGAERRYKLAAKEKLDAKAPLEEALTGSGFGEAVATAFQATNLLSQFELMRVRDALLGPTADDFIRAAARFTLGEGKAALAVMKRALAPKDAAKWTIVTYLPFLWRPEDHMFLKPEVTKDFAERVGHPFAREYSTQLDMPVYESLLDLALTTEVELADLEPRDRVDVQSFIWIVGKYEEPDGQPA